MGRKASPVWSTYMITRAGIQFELGWGKKEAHVTERYFGSAPFPANTLHGQGSEPSEQAVLWPISGPLPRSSHCHQWACILLEWGCVHTHLCVYTFVPSGAWGTMGVDVCLLYVVGITYPGCFHSLCLGELSGEYTQVQLNLCHCWMVCHTLTGS